MLRTTDPRLSSLIPIGFVCLHWARKSARYSIESCFPLVIVLLWCWDTCERLWFWERTLPSKPTEAMVEQTFYYLFQVNCSDTMYPNAVLQYTPCVFLKTVLQKSSAFIAILFCKYNYNLCLHVLPHLYIELKPKTLWERALWLKDANGYKVDVIFRNFFSLSSSYSGLPISHRYALPSIWDQF